MHAGDKAATSPEGSRCVNTGSIVLAGKAFLTLVDVLGAVNALVAWRTGADIAAVRGRSVTQGAGMTRIASAGVL